MTFQYGSAKKVAAVIRRWNPEIPIVLGGYHGSLSYKDIGASPDSGLFDFLIRGEGEKAFNQLCRTLKSASPRFDGIDNLSYKKDGEFVHNPIGPLTDLHTLQRPDRKARLYNDFSYFGTPFDCVETSRGCVKDCSFCSITKMYGKTFRKFPLDSILSQIDEIQSRGLEGIFFVDDNITLDVRWLKTLCEGIIGEGLNNIQYTMQASIDGLSREPGLPQLLYGPFVKTGLQRWAVLSWVIRTTAPRIFIMFLNMQKKSASIMSFCSV